jgi:phenylpyruvate tautomerase PptA (4-oxalocrotonate tautomerase family)
MKTELTGQMDQEMAEEITKAAQRFYGKEVRVIIDEVNDEKPRRRKE